MLQLPQNNVDFRIEFSFHDMLKSIFLFARMLSAYYEACEQDRWRSWDDAPRMHKRTAFSTFRTVCSKNVESTWAHCTCNLKHREGTELISNTDKTWKAQLSIFASFSWRGVNEFLPDFSKLHLVWKEESSFPVMNSTFTASGWLLPTDKSWNIWLVLCSDFRDLKSQHVVVCIETLEVVGKKVWSLKNGHASAFEWRSLEWRYRNLFAVFVVHLEHFNFYLIRESNFRVRSNPVGARLPRFGVTPLFRCTKFDTACTHTDLSRVGAAVQGFRTNISHFLNGTRCPSGDRHRLCHSTCNFSSVPINLRNYETHNGAYLVSVRFTNAIFSISASWRCRSGWTQSVLHHAMRRDATRRDATRRAVCSVVSGRRSSVTQNETSRHQQNLRFVLCDFVSVKRQWRSILVLLV